MGYLGMSLSKRRMRRANGSTRTAWQPERLEPRTLLAFAPIGPEFRVNTTTLGDQDSVSVASDADGDYVVTWVQHAPDSPVLTGIVFQRYASTGVPLGAETRARASAAGVQSFPAAASRADGDFVIVWLNRNDPDRIDGIYGQRFSASGAPLGDLFRVTDANGYTHGAPSLDMAPDGRFAVAWSEAGGPLDPVHSYLRAFDPSGAPLGPQVRLNEASDTGQNREPAVAIDDAGYMMAAWTRNGGGNAVYARGFNPDGTPTFAGFPVLAVPGFQHDPDVAFDRFGRAVVTWTDSAAAVEAIYARRFTVGGAPLGGPARVNRLPVAGNPATFPEAPSVATDATGGFAVAWGSDVYDGNGYGIFARRFDAAGAPIGNEFQVNTYTAGWQRFASLASDADGDLVVAWESPLQDGSGDGVYAQRFDETADRSPPVVADVSIAGRSVGAGQTVIPDGNILIRFSERLSTASGAAGANSALNPANWQLTRNGVDVSSSVQSIAFATVDRREQATLHLSSPLAAGNYVLTALDALRDLAANSLDGDIDGNAGGHFVRPFVVVNTPPTTLGLPGVTVAEDEDDSVIPLGDFFADATDPDSALTFSTPLVTNPALFSAVSVAGGTLTLDYAPDASGSSSITVRATDTGGMFVETTFLVTVLAVNDPPVNTVPGQQFAAPGQTIVFRNQNGNAISVADVDGSGRTVTVFLETDKRYTLTPSRTTGVDVKPEFGSLELRGLIPDINAALDGLQLVPDGALVGSIVLTVTTTDGGGGIGGTLTDVDTVPITFDERASGVSISDVTVTEGNTGFVDTTFTVRRNGNADREAAVSYLTTDGTAREGIDYGASSGRLVFAAGETVKSVTIRVYGDTQHEGDETFFVTLSAPSTGLTITDDTGIGTIVNDDLPGPPPTVAQVFVSGSTWTPAFKSYLASHGQGDVTYGYAIPAGAAQLAVLPWGNINRVSIRFSKDVFVLDLDLLVKGVNFSGYPIIDFDYDEFTFTGTWTLGRGVRNDKLLLVLAGGEDGVTDTAGVGLDGEWANGADAYPSGNGAAGGALSFRINVLAGDASRSLMVDATDWLQVRSRQRRSTTAPGAGSTGYSVFADLDGSGVIDSTDLLHVRRNLSRVLPGAEPASASVLATSVPVQAAAERRSTGGRTAYQPLRSDPV